LLFATIASAALISQAAAEPKQAEPATRSLNEAFLRTLPISDERDFDDAKRGLAAVIPGGVIPGPRSRPAWNSKDFDFEQNAEAPPTVNPSLWRQARLNAINGLFKVTDRVYQIRGYDISNMTIVEGDTGLIIIDPLLAIETAKAGLDLYYDNRPRKPVVAIIYTHTHADHFGGVKGVASEADVRAGKIKIFAPEHFMDFAVAENVIAGNAMSRRAWFQFGTFLPPVSGAKSTRGLERRWPRAHFR
jgi:alkyl sulfatase BDS1-like metallo-beta-lactamase superfamily hydrolase